MPPDVPKIQIDTGGSSTASGPRSHRSVAALRMTMLGVALLSFATVAHAAIEFVGILSLPQKILFALADAESGRTGWVAVGQEFAGYTVVRYDVKSDILTLNLNGVDYPIHLKPDAKTKPTRLELSGTVTFGANEKVEVIRATLQFDQENVFPLKDGMTCRLTPTRLPDGNIKFKASFERTLADNKTEIVAAPTVIVLPGHEFGIHVGDISFAFAPK